MYFFATRDEQLAHQILLGSASATRASSSPLVGCQVVGHFLQLPPRTDPPPCAWPGPPLRQRSAGDAPRLFGTGRPRRRFQGCRYRRHGLSPVKEAGSVSLHQAWLQPASLFGSALAGESGTTSTPTLFRRPAARQADRRCVQGGHTGQNIIVGDIPAAFPLFDQFSP